MGSRLSAVCSTGKPFPSAATWLRWGWRWELRRCSAWLPWWWRSSDADARRSKTWDSHRGTEKRRSQESGVRRKTFPQSNLRNLWTRFFHSDFLDFWLLTPGFWLLNMLPLTLLPTLNAILNALSAILLVSGYLFIRRRKIAAHKCCMVSAFVS